MTSSSTALKSGSLLWHTNSKPPPLFHSATLGPRISGGTNIETWLAKWIWEFSKHKTILIASAKYVLIDQNLHRRYSSTILTSFQITLNEISDHYNVLWVLQGYYLFHSASSFWSSTTLQYKTLTFSSHIELYVCDTSVQLFESHIWHVFADEKYFSGKMLQDCVPPSAFSNTFSNSGENVNCRNN